MIEIITFWCFLHDQCNAYQYLSAQGINCLLIFENGTQVDNQTIPVGENAQVYKGKYFVRFIIFYYLIYFNLKNQNKMNYFLEGVYIIIDYFFKKGKQKYPYYIIFVPF